ncbi:hypothetical protein [Kitasatospora sp. NPDC088548]|uniref:hypothetical protein n=1 Tax=Kitasatospora sp. NPDC088548 TaxID=3364075 RepID=UPI0038092707
MPAAACALAALFLVAACGSSGSFPGEASGGPAAQSGGASQNGGAAAPDAPATRNGAGAQNGAAPPAGGGGAAYVLSAPPVAAGYRQGQPPADLIQKVDSDAQLYAKRLGVTGTPVHGYYDDRAQGAWIFYSGVTGSGFDPDRLHDALNQPPATRNDGAGDRISTNAVDTDPGPHGGRAICNTVLVQNAMLTTAVTTCSWFTATTAAGVSLIIKGDGTSTKVGFTAADVAPVMRAIRADVEHPR